MIKKIYKYFEKESDQVVIELCEVFVACLRGMKQAGPEDVELYFRKFDGLNYAMTKMNPKNVKGEHVQAYHLVIERIRNNFTQNSDYS